MADNQRFLVVNLHKTVPQNGRASPLPSVLAGKKWRNKNLRCRNKKRHVRLLTSIVYTLSSKIDLKKVNQFVSFQKKNKTLSISKSLTHSFNKKKST